MLLERSFFFFFGIGLAKQEINKVLRQVRNCNKQTGWSMMGLSHISLLGSTLVHKDCAEVTVETYVKT